MYPPKYEERQYCIRDNRGRQIGSVWADLVTCYPGEKSMFYLGGSMIATVWQDSGSFELAPRYHFKVVN